MAVHLTHLKVRRSLSGFSVIETAGLGTFGPESSGGVPFHFFVWAKRTALTEKDPLQIEQPNMCGCAASCLRM